MYVHNFIRIDKENWLLQSLITIYAKRDKYEKKKILNRGWRLKKSYFLNSNVLRSDYILKYKKKNWKLYSVIFRTSITHKYKIFLVQCSWTNIMCNFSLNLVCFFLSFFFFHFMTYFVLNFKWKMVFPLRFVLRIITYLL